MLGFLAEVITDMGELMQVSQNLTSAIEVVHGVVVHVLTAARGRISH